LPARVAACVDFIGAFAKAPAEISDEDFLSANGLFQDVTTDAATFADLLASLVSALDAMTVKVSADLDSFRGLTATERFVGHFSRQRMWRRHSARVKAAPVVERLRDLMYKSDALAGLVANHRAVALATHGRAERQLVDIVERRRRLVDEIDIARIRIKELNAKALTTQGRIGVYGSKAEWERMEEERRALKAQAEDVSAQEHEMRDESQRRERFIGIFQLLVDCLNTQVGHCNTLMRKLMIDTEERLLIYQAQVDTDIPGSKVQLSSALFPNIADAIVLFERDMLLPQEIEHRKRTADAQFGKRFSAFAHEVEEAGGPLIDTTKISSRLRFRMLRS
jgi:DNA-binding protein